MSDGDFTDLMGDVEILPAGDTDLKTKGQMSETETRNSPLGHYV